MTIEFKADYNEFYKLCLKQFNKAKESYNKNLAELNNLIKAMDNSILTDTIHSKVNNLCAELGRNLSDIESYVKYIFKEEGLMRKFTSASNYLLDFQLRYNSNYIKPHLFNKARVETLNHYLMLINNITRFFVFDNEKLMNLYKKNIGKSIERSINKSLMRNPYIWAAFITGIFSLISSIILLFFS